MLREIFLEAQIASGFYQFRSELEKRGIVFSYSGILTEDILTSIGGALRQKMTLDRTDPKIARGVFSSFVEQVQNVIRYSAETQEIPAPEASEAKPLSTTDASTEEGGNEENLLRYGLVAIGRLSDGRHFVSCSNMVAASQAEGIRASLERLRGLDRKALTTLMKEQLKESPPDGSKGAGVGFITMAREALGGFVFDFYPIPDSDNVYFTFEAFV
jgi:hypothetical protein